MPIPDEMLEHYGQNKLDDIRYWVYIIYCSCQHRTFDELESYAEKRLQRKPDWLREAFESDRLYYVGQTENLQKRLGQHFKGQNSSEFTTLFDPRTIERLIPVHSRNQAERKEQRVAKGWNDPENGTFAYHN